MRNRKKTYTETEFLNNPFIVNFIDSNEDFIHLEIGCGKGGFAIDISERNKQISYVAIEREREIIVMGAKRLRELKEEGKHSGNLRFMHINADNLKDFFIENQIERIYLNFSDPWPNRKKWHKKRLTDSKYLKIYESILKSDGEIHLKTDNKEFYEFSLQSFINNHWAIKENETNLHSTNFHTSGENIMTEYEKKFSEKGMPIYRIVALKTHRSL
ncbi:MAG: tRNA (guanosine(46)-N7)-methyltransferase TrmB [Defluviitaleaceae bacterium]|nr:tRNA (guanosine(46)-N7)-methyltransferase TrmB [Defluviitaleaceae bacterium]